MKPALSGDLKKLWYGCCCHCHCCFVVIVIVVFVNESMILLLTHVYSDIEIVVEKQVFKLHHAIVWARCKWLQVLLADRWKTGAASSKEKSPVQITSFSADVFATVIEFLYTGYAVLLSPAARSRNPIAGVRLS